MILCETLGATTPVRDDHRLRSGVHETWAGSERVERELNHLPRITPNDRTPAELFAALLASENHPSAMTTRTQAIAMAGLPQDWLTA